MSSPSASSASPAKITKTTANISPSSPRPSTMISDSESIPLCGLVAYPDSDEDSSTEEPMNLITKVNQISDNPISETLTAENPIFDTIGNPTSETTDIPISETVTPEIQTTIEALDNPISETTENPTSETVTTEIPTTIDTHDNPVSEATENPASEIATTEIPITIATETIISETENPIPATVVTEALTTTDNQNFVPTPTVTLPQAPIQGEQLLSEGFGMSNQNLELLGNVVEDIELNATAEPEKSIEGDLGSCEYEAREHTVTVEVTEKVSGCKGEGEGDCEVESQLNITTEVEVESEGEKEMEHTEKEIEGEGDKEMVNVQGEGEVEVTEDETRPEKSLAEALKDLKKSYSGKKKISKTPEKSNKKGSAKKKIVAEETRSSSATRTTRGKKRLMEETLGHALERNAKKGRTKGHIPSDPKKLVAVSDETDVEKETTEGDVVKEPCSGSQLIKGKRRSTRLSKGETSSAKPKSKERTVKRKKTVEAEESSGDEAEPIPEGMTRLQDFTTRKVLRGKVLRDLLELPMQSLLKKLELQGWKQCVVDIRGECEDEVIQTFYLNCRIEGEQIVSEIAGVTVMIDANVISEILEIPNTGYCDFRKGEWPSLEGLPSAVQICRKFCQNEFENERANIPKDEMSPMHKLLFEFCTKFILPRKERRGGANRLDLVILELLDTGKQINWPALMMAHIKYVAFDSVRHSLPYGFLLIQILKQLRVPVLNPTPLYKHDMFGVEVLINCDLEVEGGHGVKKRSSRMRSMEQTLQHKDEEIAALKVQLNELKMEKQEHKAEIASLKQELKMEREETRSQLLKALGDLKNSIPVPSAVQNP